MSATYTQTARRAQILDAAIETVNALGYPRASLAEIAKRAGIAKSAIVYYFSSKDTLLLQVLHDVYADLGVAIVTAVEAADEPVDGPVDEPARRLRAYLEAYLGFVDNRRAAMAAASEIVVAHRTADGVPLYLSESADNDDSALLRGILAEGMDAGRWRRIDPATAVNLVDSLLSLAISEVQRDLAADLTAVLPEIVAFIERGLGH